MNPNQKLMLETRRRRDHERLGPISPNVIYILMRDVANEFGQDVADLATAMFAFGEDYVVDHITETHEGALRQALACFHTFTEAQGGPAHDHDTCPHRGRTTRLPEGPGAER